MSATPKQNTIRGITLGTKTDRATATTGLVGATGQLFAISGGRIVLTSMTGELTVATGATPSVGKIVATPTVGTAVDLTTTTSVASKEVGAKLTLASFGGALSVQLAGAAPISTSGIVIAVGQLGFNTSADPTGGGSAKWSITWFALDDGASVAAL